MSQFLNVPEHNTKIRIPISECQPLNKPFKNNLIPKIILQYFHEKKLFKISEEKNFFIFFERKKKCSMRCFATRETSELHKRQGRPS